jgi:ribonuclease-3
MVPAARAPRPAAERGESSGLFGGTPSALEGAEDKPRPRVDYTPLQERLGYTFQDTNLLECALTHRSALWARERADYERLEFLGDAVLDLAIADLLSDRYTEAREGELSKMRAALVNTEALASIAKGLEVGPFIRLGRGELVSGGSERPSILADVMEAIVGAIYKDGTYDVAHRIVSQIFGVVLEQVTPSDPKTELQEALHITGSEPPEYLLELVEGPDHAPIFVVIVVVDGVVVGRGRAPTKKAAQRSAAAEALAKLIPNAPEVTLSEGTTLIYPAALLVASNFVLNGMTQGARP